jgi:hypothetical protein
MKKYFVVSLIHNGILGGGIVADSEAVTYHTGKLTVPDRYRHLEMKYKEMDQVTTGWLFLLPTVTIEMKNGEVFRFAVFFSRKRLVNVLADRGVNA